MCPGYICTNISLNAITATGKKHNCLDDNQQKGMAPEVCAQKILRAMAQGKPEMLVGGKETWAVYLKRFFPGLLSRLMRRVNAQ